MFVDAEIGIWWKLPGLPGPGPGENPPILFPFKSDVSGFSSGGEIGPICPISDGSKTKIPKQSKTKIQLNKPNQLNLTESVRFEIRNKEYINEFHC